LKHERTIMLSSVIAIHNKDLPTQTPPRVRVKLGGASFEFGFRVVLLSETWIFLARTFELMQSWINDLTTAHQAQLQTNPPNLSTNQNQLIDKPTSNTFNSTTTSLTAMPIMTNNITNTSLSAIHTTNDNTQLI